MKRILIFLGVFWSCSPSSPNVNTDGKDILEVKEDRADQKAIYDADYKFTRKYYVPIYSDIYVDQQNQNKMLAATLSLRNTSEYSKILLTRIDYFNTKGKLVRRYLDSDIILEPLETINYVIEKEDEEGGSGANFIAEVKLQNETIEPLIEAIMIGEFSNKAFSFTSSALQIR